MEASIGGNANISGVETINVNSDADTEAIAASVAIAGGVVGVNAGVAAAVNRMNIKTFVGKDVSISGNDLTGLNVASDSFTGADAWLMNVAGGAVAVGLSGAVTVVMPTVYTFVGVEPGKEETESSTGTISVPNADVSVSHNVTSSGSPVLLSANAGGVAAAGSLLLTFNRTNAIAGILRKSITADDIDIDANMDANAESIFSSATVGGAAVGISVAYVHLRANNEAILDVTGSIVNANTADVYAGRANDSNSMTATAISVSTNGGLAAVGSNTAIADNAAKNIARVVGAVSETMNLIVSGALNIEANGKATAEASMLGLNIAGISVSNSNAVAVLRSEQKAAVEQAAIQAGALTVKSNLNVTTVDADKDTAKATITTGTGAMHSASANVAVAYGRSQSIANVSPSRLTLTGGGDVVVGSYGNAGVLANVTNIDSPVSGMNAAAVIGAAYAQGQFTAVLNIPEGGTANVGQVEVKTESMTRADTDLTPSLSGVSGASINVNAAIAIANAVAKAAITGLGTLTANLINVEAVGTSYTDAEIHTPVISVDGVKIAASVLVSLLKTQQTAEIADVTAKVSGAVNVKSTLNATRDVTANAVLGDNFGTAGDGENENAEISASMAEAKANVAVAKSDARGAAKITGAKITANGQKITLSSTGKSAALATTPASNASSW